MRFLNTTLQQVLTDHNLWLNNNGGSRANLSDANLSGANLYGVNLSGANLSDANLSGADLSRANLYGANLSDANLSDANLSRANLSSANLSGANLYGVNLSGANLYGVNLSGADLSGANLSGANLSRADLYGVNLSGANLSEIKNFNRYMYSIVPEKGNFIAFKKASNLILEIEISTKAKRLSHFSSRKCRASQVKVISITNIDGTKQSLKSVRGNYDYKTVYTVGRITKADKFDNDNTKDCSNGIHFFITRQEACDY